MLFSDSPSAVAAGIESLALSPDGRWLAVSRWTPTPLPQLFVIPSSGGDPRQLLGPSVDDWRIDGAAIAWSHHGRHIFVVKKPAAAGGLLSEIWQIPVVGGEPRDTGIRWAGRITRISAHPDGRRLAISTQSQRSPETWVLQNIPPQREKQ